MPMITFLVYISLNWWADLVSRRRAGRGRVRAQRMFSAKDERHSLLATLWFNIAHYAIRAVAVDPRGARLADSLSGIGGPGDRLYPRDDRPLPASLRGL